MGELDTHVLVGLGERVGGHCDKGYLKEDEME